LKFLQTANNLLDNGGNNPTDAGNIHLGFCEAFLNINKDRKFYQTISDCVKNNVPTIKFTGHSLGGAIATLAVMWFKAQFPSYAGRVHYATFGSPRVGDAAFQAKFLSMLPRMGNRYESVRPQSTESDWYTLGLTSSVVSPPGDHALPGDVIPRVPPMRDTAIVVSKLLSPAFWLAEESAIFLFGGSDDASGYRHVGVRFQIPCASMNLITCHSAEDIYQAAFEPASTDPSALGGNAV